MSGWENPTDGGPRRRVLPAVVVVSLVAAALLALVATLRARTPSDELEITREVEPRPDPTTAAPWAPPAPGTWRRLPPAPLESRIDYTVAWTGSEMIVWGGFDALNRPRHNGAAFDPVLGTWRLLPTSAVTDAAADAVVAGTDVVFVSSTGTWRYDPASGRWQTGPALQVPDGHTVGDHIVAAGWIVLAVTEPHFRDAPSGLFALRPGSAEWQRLADVPVTMTTGHTALASGSQILVFGPPVGDQPAAIMLDMDETPPRWRRFPAPPGLDQQELTALSGIAAGDRIMLWGARADAPTGYAAIWEDGRWRSVDPGPLRPGRAIDVMWTGGRMLLWDRLNNAGALFDPRTERWTGVPPPPVVGMDLAREAVWTGYGLLVWGALGSGGAIYTPV
jgi:hypothetical protein